MNPLTKQMLLLQINDALFPIGGYSHSYGLETYIQKGIVKDEETAADYIGKRLSLTFAYGELLTVKIAYEKAQQNDPAALAELEKLLAACQIPRETRQALKKLGTRFVKTLMAINISYEQPVFSQYVKNQGTSGVSHAIAYGVFCAAVGIQLKDALEHYLYAQTSAMVTACVKSVPLSQTVGQRILARCCENFSAVLKQTGQSGIDMLYLSAPGFDIRCIQHETLYSRIYMS